MASLSIPIKKYRTEVRELPRKIIFFNTTGVDAVIISVDPMSLAMQPLDTARVDVFLLEFCQRCMRAIFKYGQD